MLAAMELGELRRLALATPSSTRLLDLAVIATLERLAVELERLAGPSNEAGSAPVALRSASASALPRAERVVERRRRRGQ